MMRWAHEMPVWGGHWFGGLLVLFFWIIVIVGIVALLRGIFSRGGGSPAASEGPLEILKRRYARGEIDKAEFEEKRKDILGS